MLEWILGFDVPGATYEPGDESYEAIKELQELELELNYAAFSPLCEPDEEHPNCRRCALNERLKGEKRRSCNHRHGNPTVPTNCLYWVPTTYARLEAARWWWGGLRKWAFGRV